MSKTTEYMIRTNHKLTLIKSDKRYKGTSIPCQVCGEQMHKKNGNVCIKADCKEQWAIAWAKK